MSPENSRNPRDLALTRAQASVAAAHAPNHRKGPRDEQTKSREAGADGATALSGAPLALNSLRLRRKQKMGRDCLGPGSPRYFALSMDGGVRLGWDGGPTRHPAPCPASEPRKSTPSPLGAQHPPAPMPLTNSRVQTHREPMPDGTSVHPLGLRWTQDHTGLRRRGLTRMRCHGDLKMLILTNPCDPVILDLVRGADPTSRRLPRGSRPGW